MSDDLTQPSTFTRILGLPITRALIALLLVILLGFIFNADGAFLKLGTHRDALRQTSVYGMLACGMTLVIISGGIDLTVGSVLALVAVVFSMLTIHDQMTPWLAIPISLAVGGACGAVSGAITSVLKVQPFIATLAMMVFARGLAKYASGGMTVSNAVRQDDGSYVSVPMPDVFDAIETSITWNGESIIYLVSILFLACVAIAALLLTRHKWGRELYAIGGNEEAARLSGVPVVRSKLLAYVASGVFAAVAGICHAAQSQQGDPEAGVAYELTAIAMVVIGGTSLMGGVGGVGLTLIGVFTIGYLEKILSINAVPEAGRLLLTGVIIIIAVLAQRRRST